MMRKFIFVFIFSFSLLLPHLNAELDLLFPDPEVTISLDLRDASLKDILKIFSIQSGLNFIASEAVQDRKVTLYLDKVTIKDAMDKLFEANNLSYELDKKANIFIVKDWGRPKIETITKIFYLKYHTVPSAAIKKEISSNLGGDVGDIVSSIKNVLSEYGKISEDSRSNSLIISDISSRFPLIEEVIRRLDTAQPQVMLEVEMLDVGKSIVDKIGFKFGQTPMTMVLTGIKRGTWFPFRDTSLPTTAQPQMTPGSIDFSTATYTVLLDFLKTQGDTKYLARPRILTLNNQTAQIKISTKEMIGTVTVTTTAEGTATTSAQAERIDTGVDLRVTPQINPDAGEITMFIMPVIKDATASTLDPRFKDPEERSTKSVVRVKDGQTVVIGGLIRNDKSVSITKLPILGDIPIVGLFFRHKERSRDKQRELLVFITPHIIKDARGPGQAGKVSLPEREQDVVSGIDRQRVISASLNNFEKKKK